jgi:ubiquitin-activating enzyme E1
MAFKSFNDSLSCPFAPGRSDMDNCDFEKWGRPELLHIALNGLYEFVAQKGSLPKIND